MSLKGTLQLVETVPSEMVSDGVVVHVVNISSRSGLPSFIEPSGKLGVGFMSSASSGT